MPLNFLDDKGPGAAAPDEPKDKKKEDHRQMLLVIASLVGVVIAWFTYKSIRGGASASGAPVSSASIPATTSGSVLGSGGDTDAVNGFTSYLQNLTGQLTQLQNTINTQANGTGTLPATTSTQLPVPIASTLFAPAASSAGYGRTQSGLVYQIESDGSELGLTAGQWTAAQGQGAQVTNQQSDNTLSPAYYDVSGNLQAAGKSLTTPAST